MNILSTTQIPEMSDQAADKAEQLRRRSAAAGDGNGRQRNQAKKVAQDFEALFVGMMVKSMRGTVPQEKTLTGGGRGEEIYRSMLDQEYANASVKNGGIGLAKQIEKEMLQRESGRTRKIIDHHE